MFKYPVQLVNVFIIVHKYILILDVTGTVSACVSSVGRWSRLPACTSVRRLVRSLLPSWYPVAWYPVATLCCRAAGPAQPFLNFCCRGLQRQCVSEPPEPHFQKKGDWQSSSESPGHCAHGSLQEGRLGSSVAAPLHSVSQPWVSCSPLMLRGAPSRILVPSSQVFGCPSRTVFRKRSINPSPAQAGLCGAWRETPSTPDTTRSLRPATNAWV